MRRHAFSFVVICIAIANLWLMRHCAEQHHVRFGGFRTGEESSP